MKPFLAFLLLLTLAACAQSPTPGVDALPSIAPLKFGSAGFDEASSLAPHSSGVYVVGFTTGNLHGTNKGRHDAFIRKYDRTGRVLWGKQFGTVEYDDAKDVATDGNNNAYVVGTTYGRLVRTPGREDPFIRKYNASGSVVWTRQFGSSDYESAIHVATYGNNAVYVAGITFGDFVGGQTSFIRKYNASGSVVWTKGIGGDSLTQVIEVVTDSSGNIYVAGSTYTSLGSGGFNMFMRKYNPSGGVVWTKRLNYGSSDSADAVAVTGSNVYVVGTSYTNDWTEDDVKVIKLNTSGSLIWERSFSEVGVDYVNDVTADSTGVIFAGLTEASFAGPFQGGFSDGYVYKLDSSGNFVWSKQQGTTGGDSTHAVLVRSNGEVYAAGNTSGVLGLSNSGSYDAFLRRLNGSNGATNWTDQ